MAKILILGGGFSGITAAERLATLLGTDHRITLLSLRPKFVFYPALVDVAFGRLEVPDVTFDLEKKLAESGVNFIEGSVTQINHAARLVEYERLKVKGEISYDYLLIASGRKLAVEQVPGYKDAAHHLLGIVAALKFGEAVSDFRSGTIILGLCPGARLPVPVCETAFALAAKFKKEIKNGSVHLKVIFPESLEDAFGGANLHRELESAFKQQNIVVLYKYPIQAVRRDEVISVFKHRIKHDLLMLLPPFRGNELYRSLKATNDEDYIKVDRCMRVLGHENIYAAGDIVAFSGPKFAHMAVRQAVVAAENIAAQVCGKPPSSNYYHEIAAIINAHGADSIYLHHGIWDNTQYKLDKGRIWGWAKQIHDKYWQIRHL